ncbi:MAG: hypothetical protein QME94_13000, partial [Anaerolineae bacterium]|nr:hypothetical protein [Anaerolineae bacterium]
MTRERARNPASPQPSPDLRWLRQRKAWGLILGGLTLLSALALLSVVRGALGAAIAGEVRGLFGWGAFPALAMSLAVSVWLVGDERLAARIRVFPSQVLGAELLLFACLGLLHLPMPALEGYVYAERGGAGGFVGWSLVRLLSPFLGRAL